MRICLVSHFLPPERDAGTENYTWGLARALVQRGHEVDALCASGWETGERYWNGVGFERLDGIGVTRIRLNWMRAAEPNRAVFQSDTVRDWVERWLRDRAPDVVHVTSAITLGTGVLEAPHRLGLPLVLTLMDFWFLCARTVLARGSGELCDGRTTAWDCQRCVLDRSGLFRRLHPFVPPAFEPHLWHAVSRVAPLTRLRGIRGLALDTYRRKRVMAEAIELPDVVVAHSNVVRRLFAEAGLSARVRHVPNGHDLDWLGRFPGRTPSPELRIGYMGQIAEIKGVHTLIDGYRRADLGARARLDIWGHADRDPVYRDRLVTLAGDRPDIRLRGPFTRTALPDVLADTDVLVVPSLWHENAPLVIHEAFAAGIPVVASDCGGMAEAVSDGVDGLLFERGNATDLARQLRRLVDEPGLLSTLRAGIPRVRRVDEEVDEVVDLYREAIAAHGLPPPADAGARVDAGARSGPPAALARAEQAI
jgi:glycosyltransferase involved in cell wall biosynthesis